MNLIGNFSKGRERIVLFIGLIFLGLSNLQSQITSEGKKFYLSFMEMETRTGVYPDSLLLFMVCKTNCSATIANKVLGISQTVSLTAGKVNRFALDPANYYPTGSEPTNADINRKRSVEVTSTAPISVYAMNFEQNRSDGTFVLPYAAIPKAPEFLVQSYCPNVKNGSNFTVSEFVIINMEKSSVDVEITPTAATKGGNAAGTAFTVTLAQYQIYQVQSKVSDGNQSTPTAGTGDMTGSRVRVINGCGKINVFSGSQSIFISKVGGGCGSLGRDHAYTQCLPTNILGKDYILMPFKGQSGGYVFKVVASQNSTTVKVNGTTVATLNKGQQYYEDVTSAAVRCVNVDKPAYVTQYMKDGVCSGYGGQNGDAAMFVMPDIKQQSTSALIGTATTNNMKLHWVNILVRSTATAAVKFNGSYLSPAAFTSVGCNSSYAYAQVALGNPSTNQIDCDSGFIVVAYGIGQFESYAYCSGALFEDLNYDIKITQPKKCPEKIVKFDAVAIGPTVLKYLWNFGDGATDTGKNVQHAYATPGKYYVEMRAVTAGSCGKNDTNVRSKLVNVYPGPVSPLKDTINICHNNTFNYTLDALYNIKFTYNWDNGAKTQKRTVSTTGKYTVFILDTSTNCSVFDSTYVRRVNSIDTRVKYDTTGYCFPASYFVMSDGTQYTGDATKKMYMKLTFGAKTWDTISNNGPRIARKFATTGTYTVQLIVESMKECRDTSVETISVVDRPTAVMGTNTPPFCQKATYTFTDNSVSTDGIGSRIWNWNDLSPKDSVTTKTQNHTFALSDTFAVRLITISKLGCRDTVDSNIVVYPLPVTKINIVSQKKCFNNNAFIFADSTKIPIGSYTRKWMYDINKNSTLQPLSYTYIDTGKKTVKLIATSDKGCKDSTAATVNVYPNPKAKIQVPDSQYCFKGHWFSFKDISTFVAGSNLATRKWTFSDGTTSAAANINKKTFAAASTYNGKLVITNNYGCMDSVVRSFTIYQSANAKFSIAPDTAQCLVGNKFTFTPSFAPPTGVVNHFWDYGDTTFNYAPNPPNKTYTSKGVRVVKYLIQAPKGCNDSATRIVSIVETPKASFTATPDFCLGKGNFNFTNTSTFAGVLNNKWTLGDGNSANTKDVLAKTYASAGPYTVKLLVTSPTGCKDSTNKPVNVWPVPTVNFTCNDTIQCASNSSFQYLNFSTNNGATTVTYTWDFEDGTNYVGQNLPNRNVTAIKTGWVKLTGVTDKGCSVAGPTISYQTIDTPQVLAAFTNECAGVPVDFDGTSLLVAPRTIATQGWKFGSNPGPLTEDCKNTFPNAGTYSVLYTVVDDQGCIGRAGGNITIFPLPKAGFTYDYLETRGLQTDYQFNSTSTGTVGYDWQFADGQNNSANNCKITFNDTGKMRARLLVTSADGCEDSAVQILYLKPELQMWLPTSFSPNNDGLNETFGPNTTYGLSKYKMVIFDRWGAKIYQTNDPQKPWNGKMFNTGNLLPNGFYPYSIVFRYIDGKLFVFNGTVLINR